MTKSKYIYNLFFFVVFLTFAFYESAEMSFITKTKLDLGSESVVYRYKAFLFVLCTAFCLFQKPPKIKYLSTVLSVLLLYVWGVSILHFTGGGFVRFFVFSTDMLLPLVFFFYFYNVAQTISTRVFYAGLLLTVLILFYSFVDTYQLYLMFSQTEDVRASSSYIFLFFLPFSLLSRNLYVKWGCVVLVACLMVFSMKRGGLLSFSLALIVYYITMTISADKKVRFKTLFLMLFMLFVISLVVSWGFEKYVDELLQRFASISDDGGSARDVVYELTWKMIINSDTSSFLFGHGWNMVLADSPKGLSAHNDFLEVLYDFGIFALFLYVFMYYRLYKAMRLLVKKRSENAAPFAFSVTTFIVNSMIAHVFIYPFNFIAVTAVWGYILGKEKMSNQTFQIAKR